MIPSRNFDWYAGVDPGYKGAISLMNAKGTDVRCWPMPVHEDRSGLDYDGLRDIFRRLAILPGKTLVGIEWPEAFPGSFNNVLRDAEHFGQQKGILEAFAFLHRLEHGRVSPVQWKGRLGLDGKQVVGANERAAKLFNVYYPERADLYRGPRGGLLDGPLDALLIAHFLRTRTADGMKSIAEKFGKDSVESFAFVMGGARRRRKFGRRI